jgi:hypothetical protein
MNPSNHREPLQSKPKLTKKKSKLMDFAYPKKKKSLDYNDLNKKRTSNLNIEEDRGEKIPAVNFGCYTIVSFSVGEEKGSLVRFI